MQWLSASVELLLLVVGAVIGAAGARAMRVPIAVTAELVEALQALLNSTT